MFILNIIHIRLVEFHSQRLTRKTSYPEKGQETTGENITSCFTLRRINQRKFYLFKSGFLVKKINNPLVKKITYETYGRSKGDLLIIELFDKAS